MRTAQWGVVGVMAVAVLALGAQPAQSAPALHVTFPEAAYGQLAPSTTLLATGRPDRQVTTRVHVDERSPGPTPVLVLIGRPGTTDDAEQDADLPPNAVRRPGNELVADVITTSAVPSRFLASADGQYP